MMQLSVNIRRLHGVIHIITFIFLSLLVWHVSVNSVTIIRYFRLGFVMNRVALRQVFFRYFGFLFQFSFHWLFHIVLSFYHWCCIACTEGSVLQHSYTFPSNTRYFMTVSRIFLWFPWQKRRYFLCNFHGLE